MSDTDYGRKAPRNCRVEPVNLSESESDHSRQRVRYETYKKEMTLAVIRPVFDHYIEYIYLCTYRLANTSSLYDDQVVRNVAKWAKCPQGQIRTSIFDLFDTSPSSIFIIV